MASEESFLQELTALRQRSINDFIRSGGSNAAECGPAAHGMFGQSVAQFSRDVAMATHPAYWACVQKRSHRELVQSLPYSIDSVAGQLCMQKLSISDVQLAPAGVGATAPSQQGVTEISFDNDGVLFAVGSASGAIGIYDFDECSAAMRLRYASASIHF